MSCGCNSSPCSCLPRPSVCCTPTVESVTYTFENAGTSGIGVFDNETDFLVQFRNIVSESVALTVALDAGNNTIVLDFDDTQLIAAIPDATTTQRGILETSTDAEALAKSLNSKILTPSNLAALGGTTSFAGFLELATNAETITGTDTARATTPAGVAAAAALYRTVTFADAATRGGTVPNFAGQFGVQLDTDQAFISYGTSAGEWYSLFTLGVTSTMYGATSLDLNGGSLTFHSGSLVLGGTTTNTISGSTTFDNAQLTFSNVTVLDYGTDTVLRIGAVDIPANSVLVTGGTAGLPASRLLNTFLSTANVQTGWAVTNPSVTRTLDVSAATLGDVRAVLGTLINDLKAVLLPAT